MKGFRRPVTFDKVFADVNQIDKWPRARVEQFLDDVAALDAKVPHGSSDLHWPNGQLRYRASDQARYWPNGQIRYRSEDENWYWPNGRLAERGEDGWVYWPNGKLFHRNDGGNRYGP
ncbi:MAG: hypothetical protein H6662_20155 [Ardenticatenaceae bacterium]|nr:hypothetical protein [Anaerolineales bacterium]MCB8923899.1 hypothetical protein [Ardenticatenaceae bacterium]MCB8990456.1 hypothetical protein [Ardenticatenaceae bacterium]MCB9003470.1 hypothetical protein [Ardenticatenaceae bacterium]